MAIMGGALQKVILLGKEGRKGEEICRSKSYQRHKHAICSGKWQDKLGREMSLRQRIDATIL